MLMTVAKRIEEVASAYYRQMEHYNPKEKELIDWFVQLSSDDKTLVAAVHPDAWPALTGFQRYYLEKQGHSMHAYMAGHLTGQELSEWMDEEPTSVMKRPY